MRPDPARSCRPSTFWVMSSAGSIPASARCPGLGSAPVIVAQPRWLRAQYRRWASGPETNSWKVIGVRAGEPGPR